MITFLSVRMTTSEASGRILPSLFKHLRSRSSAASTPYNEAQAPTAEMAETPPSIRKSAPTTYTESSDAR